MECVKSLYDNVKITQITEEVFLLENDNIKKVIKITTGKTRRTCMEAHILQKLNSGKSSCKYIIKVNQIIKHTPYTIIDFPYYAGSLYDDLNGRYKKEQFYTLNKLRKRCKQLLIAVKFCHDNDVVHMDIKPENILLDKHDNIALTDFGLSVMKEYDHEYRGTALYVAPEVAKLNVTEPKTSTPKGGNRKKNIIVKRRMFIVAELHF
jgi:serine/threonine protein kinase